MGRRRSMSENENAEIVKMLVVKSQTIDIAKQLNQDRRTIKKYVQNINTQKKRFNAAKQKMTSREIRKLKFALSNNPLA